MPLPPGRSVGTDKAPTQRLAARARAPTVGKGVYFVTAGTLYKRHLFDMPAKLDLGERLLLSMPKTTAGS